MKCIGCGKTQASLSGGVGFWDLVSGKPSANAQVVIPTGNGKTERLVEKVFEVQKKQQQRTEQIARFIAAILGFSILLNIISLCLLVHLNSDHTIMMDTLDTLQAEVTSLSNVEQEQVVPTEEMTLPTEAAELPPETETGTEAAQETTAAVEETTPEIIITKEPTDVLVTREPLSAPKLVFTVAVQGNPLTYQWERWNDASAIWEPIDDNRFDIQNGSSGSELLLCDFSPEIYGTYRCVIKDEFGNESYSHIVRILDLQEDLEK